jgi:hypothetical protein
MKEAEINNKQRKLVKRKLPPGTQNTRFAKLLKNECLLSRLEIVITFINNPHAVARLLGLLIQMMKMVTLIMTVMLDLEW